MAKAGSLKLCAELLGREEKPEGFAGRGDAGGERVESRLSSRAEGVARHAVVETDTGARLQSANGLKRRAECFEREIGNHTKPTEKSGRLRIEASLGEAFGQGVVLKVEGNEGQVVRLGDGSFGQHRTLPCLCGGKVYLEDAELRKRISVGEGIQSRPEHHVLGDALRYRLSETILGVTAAHGHKGAKDPREWLHLLLAIVFKTCAENGDRNRIVKDWRLIENLVNGAAARNAECGLTGPASFHGSSLQAAMVPTPTQARMLIGMNWTASWTGSWIGWALLSAVFAAATALLAKVGVEHVDSNLATAFRTSVVVVFAWGIALALGKHGEMRLLDRRTVLFLALSGIATGLSWLCYFRALQLGPASRVAPLDKLSVPLVMVFAWVLLGEKLSAAAMVGGLLITAGAIVMVLG